MKLTAKHIKMLKLIQENKLVLTNQALVLALLFKNGLIGRQGITRAGRKALEAI